MGGAAQNPFEEIATTVRLCVGALSKRKSLGIMRAKRMIAHEWLLDSEVELEFLVLLTAEA